MSREKHLSVSFEGGDRGTIGDEFSQMRGAFLQSKKIQDSDRCTGVHIDKVPLLSWPQKLDSLGPLSIRGFVLVLKFRGRKRVPLSARGSAQSISGPSVGRPAFSSSYPFFQPNEGLQKVEIRKESERFPKGRQQRGNGRC